MMILQVIAAEIVTNPVTQHGGITFDWTISIGQIAMAIVFVGGWVIAFIKLQGRTETEFRIIKHDIKSIMQRQENLGESFSSLTSILTKVAVQDERLNSFDHRIDNVEQDIRDMQRGIGFKEREITGEYSRHGKIKS